MAETPVKLSVEDLRREAARIPGWHERDGRRLRKTFLFPDFAAALAFVNRVGEAAEAQGHHPDLHLAWGRVDVETSTHDVGGLTESDLRLAEEIDRQSFKWP